MESRRDLLHLHYKQFKMGKVDQKENNKQIIYRLEEVELCSYFINNKEKLNIKKFDKTKVKYNVRQNLSLDENKSIFEIHLVFIFSYKLNQEDQIDLFGAEIATKFYFENFKGVISKKSSNELNIPNDLLLTLFSISFSTSRGYLASLISSTDYKGVYLPVINPTSVLKVLMGVKKTEKEKIEQ